MTIGERIKELREVKNLTHIELAKQINYSVGVISLWENNLRKPNSDSLIALAKFFDVTAGYILGLED